MNDINSEGNMDGAGAMKHFFVVNPHSFRKRGGMRRVINHIENVFAGENKNDGGADYEIYVSRYPRDAIAAVHHYVSRFPQDVIARVYAVGGDGILYDCLNGMAGLPNAELASVPYGSANDFIRSAFGENMRERFRDIAALRHAPARPVDAISYDGNYAINELHVGQTGQGVLFANAVLKNKHTRRLAGIFTKQIYTAAYIHALLIKKTAGQHYKISLDGEDYSGKYRYMLISNGGCDGGKMLPSPHAKVNDGALNVIFTRPESALKLIWAIGAYNSGKFEKYPAHFERRAKKIEIESELPLHVSADGEAFTTDALMIETLPDFVKFAAPADIKFADHSHRAHKNKRGETS